ncbi:MAG: hypothetical protein WBA51_13270, partial [Erythrobacter sp.]
MRAFIDLIDSVTNGIRAIVGLIVLACMGFGLLVTFGATQIASSVSEEARSLGSKAIEADLKAQRSKDLAKEGWGYPADGFGEENDAASQRR